MSILKLAPAYKDYLWGGNKLIRNFRKEYSGSVLAETWELSCHKDGMSTICNGTSAGMTLTEYVESNGIVVLGENCRKYENFPILVKLIDARDNLSIQVHPNNEFAMKFEKQKYGKLEAWYVVEAEENAGIYYGVKEELSKSEFVERIQNNTILEALNFQKVKKGDTFFIPYGMIHAIGGGVMIAEIQQNSNITYRVYDFDRVGPDGKKRELNIEKAKEVAILKPVHLNLDAKEHMIQCEFFTVDELNVQGEQLNEAGNESFHSILVLEGEGVIKEKTTEEEIEIKKGDSIFVTAGTGEYIVKGKLKSLLTTVR